MSMDPTWLFLSLVPGGIGFVLVAYGRKQERLIYVGAGVLFMAYPYFTPSVAGLVGVGVAIAAGLWVAVRAGW